ncbi:MAG: hypothetical protein M0Z78_08865 [Betaproteobacteria bacterium]|nr:hypothetical protein [Betaproteobacteria bacterium]
MQRLISEIAEAHGLNFDTACSLVERAASSSLTAVMNIDAYARFDGEKLGFYRFDVDRGEVEIRANNIHKRVARRLRYEIDRLISSESAANDVEQARRLLYRIVIGRIRSFTPEGVHATVDLPNGGTVTAYCPAYAMSPKDAPQYGRRLSWYVSKVIVRTGRPPRIEMLLSRTSKEFVAGLIRGKAEFVHADLNFKVTKRVPGLFVKIEASSFIPPNIIQTVALDLGERILIKKGKTYDNRGGSKNS